MWIAVDNKLLNTDHLKSFSIHVTGGTHHVLARPASAGTDPSEWITITHGTREHCDATVRTLTSTLHATTVDTSGVPPQP
jgi:hypothetical protein